jgi:hypothetical protein
MIYDNIEYDFDKDGLTCTSIRHDTYTNEYHYNGQITLNFSDDCLEAIRNLKEYTNTFFTLPEESTIWYHFDEDYLPDYLQEVSKNIPQILKDEFDNAGCDWDTWNRWSERILNESSPPDKTKPISQQQELPFN